MLEPDYQTLTWDPLRESLGVALWWVEQHCVVPDGENAGDPFKLLGWQAFALAHHYRVKPTAKVGQFAPAFHYRRSQIVLPQKAGKGPYSAAQICLEGVGPALFAGWASGGEQYVCPVRGCPCNDDPYVYEPGEPMGRPWATPLIQVTATSEEQTDNVYDALRPMIQKGPLAQIIPKTGEEFIRLPNKGRIDTVTSNARSRLGARVTFVPQDETGIWTPATGMVKVAETQRRGLAGMGGRASETTNPWDPTENSVAQRTAESLADDIFRLHPLAPSSLSYKNKRERRKIHGYVYFGCEHVDLDAIEAEAFELIEVDPAQAERFFGNRVVAGSGLAYDADQWDALAVERPFDVPPDGNLITIGVDGARFDDALAIIGTDVVSGHQWPLGIWQVPVGADSDYEHDVSEGGEVDGVMAEAFDRWQVWRVYIDPQRIEKLVNTWQGRWSDQVVLEWFTNRPKQMAYAVRNHVTAVGAGDLSHDGDGMFARHIKQAVRQKVNVKDDDDRQMFVLSKDRPFSPFKMDGAVAAVISWEARGDAIAAGATKTRKVRAGGF